MDMLNKEKIKSDEEIMAEVQNHMKKENWDIAMNIILKNIERDDVKYWKVLKQFAKECPVPSMSGIAYYVMGKTVDNKEYFLKAAEKFEEAAREKASTLDSTSEREKVGNEAVEDINDSIKFFLSAAYCYYYADKPEKGRAILIHNLNMPSEKLFYELKNIYKNKVEKTYHLPFTIK